MIAEEFIEATRINLRSSLRTSANRIYFAFEKAIESYILYMEKKIPKNHQKIWELSSELLGEEYYNHFRILYDLRMQADYGTASIIVLFNESIVKENLHKTETLIKDIKMKLLEKRR